MEKYAKIPKIHFKLAEIRGEMQGGGVFTYSNVLVSRGGQLPPPPLGFTETTHLVICRGKYIILTRIT